MNGQRQPIRVSTTPQKKSQYSMKLEDLPVSETGTKLYLASKFPPFPNYLVHTNTNPILPGNQITQPLTQRHTETEAIPV